MIMDEYQDDTPGPSDLTQKRVKRGRATAIQTEALIGLLEQNASLVIHKFKGVHGKKLFHEGWQQVADALNEMPGGALKTPIQWQRLWRDIKHRACAKTYRLHKRKKATGNRCIPAENLTTLEQRIVTLLGPEYVFGTNTTDLLEVQLKEDKLEMDPLQAGDQVSDEGSRTSIDQEDTSLDMSRQYSMFNSTLHTDPETSHRTTMFNATLHTDPETSHRTTMFNTTLHADPDTSHRTSGQNDYAKVEPQPQDLLAMGQTTVTAITALTEAINRQTQTLGRLIHVIEDLGQIVADKR